MTHDQWMRAVELLLELGMLDFAVFGSDEAEDIIEHLIELADRETR